MRSDRKGLKGDPAARDQGFRSAENRRLGGARAPTDVRINDDGSSMSGGERNHFFLSLGCGEQFADISAISGLDSAADGRAFACWDFDRDGWTDIALVNANAPQLGIYRNNMGDLERARGGSKGSIALRFAGGNRRALPSGEWSNADGYGARVVATLSGRRLTREQRAGEGLAAQNSATMVIGIGAEERVERLEVLWPSGIRRSIEAVPVGSLVDAYEDPTQSPTGEAFVVSEYGADR